MMSDTRRVLRLYESPNGMNLDPLSATIIGHPGLSLINNKICIIYKMIHSNYNKFVLYTSKTILYLTN